MQFHLQHFRFDRCSRHQIADQRNAEIAHPEVTDQSRLLQLHQRLPGFQNRNRVFAHPRLLGIGVKEPTGRIAFLQRDERQRNRKVNVIQIQVVQFQVGQRFFAGRADVFGAVIGVPQFARHPQVLAADQAGIDCLANPVAGFGLVAVIAGGVDVTVADFDGLTNDVRGDVLIDFPKPQSDRGNRGAAGELEFGTHACGFRRFGNANSRLMAAAGVGSAGRRGAMFPNDRGGRNPGERTKIRPVGDAGLLINCSWSDVPRFRWFQPDVASFRRPGPRGLRPEANGVSTVFRRHGFAATPSRAVKIR